MSSSGSPSTPVIVEREGPVLVVTLNRPDVLNAVDGECASLLAGAFDDLDQVDDLRVGVLAGGPRVFSTGMDMRAYADGNSPLVPGRGFGGLTERQPKKPLIAAVEGYALAGGFEMALACDLIIASRTAEFGLPEVTRGLIASAGGLLRLPHRVPYQLAMKLALTGERLDAEQALAHGLVVELVESGAARRRAIELGEQIARNGPLAIQLSKRSISRLACPVTPEMWSEQESLQRLILGSEDAREGVEAFREKRSPQWVGR